MKYFFSFLLSLSALSCNTHPSPLVAGKDVCQSCRMPVADIRFGAEIITTKGKLYKFDDVVCMFHYLQNGLHPEEKIKQQVAEIYTNPLKLVDVDSCFFLKSDQLRSPMNSGAAAFESRRDADSFLNDYPGEILSWQQLQQKLQ